MAKRAKLVTEDELPEPRFDSLARAFCESADDLGRFSRPETIADLLTFLAEPARRRTLRRRAHKFGYWIDQERARQGFEALQAVFSLLAETEASNDDGSQYHTDDLLTISRPRGVP
jgi:hypothetical protein